jgi:hypothetical protein
MRKMIASLIVLGSLVFFVPSPVEAQSHSASGFLGAWCAQGDPAKRTSITSNEPFLTLTNEVGSTSSGHTIGLSGREIIAPAWQLVRGTLSADDQTISWSNGTFWRRCHSRRQVDVEGTWFFGGDRSKPCHIDQHGEKLTLRNESGQSATGTFTGTHTISTVWMGTHITGTVSHNQKHILWSNGTYWTR